MTDKKNDIETAHAPDPGIFVTKEMIIDCLPITIRFNDEGSIDADPVILHTWLDLCPHWIEIALMHLEDSEKAHARLIESKKAQDADAIAGALSDDFRAGMQTIMACAIALDAYYASINERANLPFELIQTWRKKGTARYKQIAEVFRRSFMLKPEPANRLRELLKYIFSYRDKAVHPATGTIAPVLHPELNKVTDWRYSTFRNYNAKTVAKVTLSIIDQTTNKVDKQNEELETYCNKLSGSIELLIKKWEGRYGSLYK